MKVAKTVLTGLQRIAHWQAPSKPSQKAQAPKCDRVSISKAAKRLLAETGASVDESGEAEAIKKRIDSGKYMIDPQKIADSIIDFYG